MRDRWRIGLYFAPLLLFSGLGDPTGLISVPLLFILKDRLHCRPQAIAVFEAITMVPYYCCFAFGLLRDHRRRAGWPDRRYLMLATPIAVAGYAWVAVGPLGYAELLAAVLVAMAAYQMLDVAVNAMMTEVAQREAMTGRLTAIAETLETVVSVISMLAGGWMVAHCSSRTVFLTAAVLSSGVFVHAFWRSDVISATVNSAAQDTAAEWKSMPRLIRHPALWPTAVILLLYNFSPGWGTPFFYFLTDHVGLSSEAYGVCRAVHFGSVLLVSAAYTALCRHVPLNRLLWYAVVLNIFPGFLFLVVHRPAPAIAVSLLVGGVVGFAMLTFFDLLMRACPQGLEGCGSTLGHSAFGMAGVAADLLGAFVYEHAGFAACLAIDAVATALILPVLRYLPNAIVSTLEGEVAESAVAGA